MWWTWRYCMRQNDKINALPFFELILDCNTKYNTAITTFEKIYNARTLNNTCGSSNGIFFETCIMPRMIMRFVLQSRPSAVFMFISSDNKACESR